MTEETLKKLPRYYPEETEEYWKQHRSCGTDGRV
jgi:hypothetical protein